MRSAVVALALLAISGAFIADAAAKTTKATRTHRTARTAVPTKSCFRHLEAVADQAIRYTTEIMVVSDTCRNPTYERFVQRNRLEVVNFQNVLKEHFRRSAGRSAQAKLDAFMTHLANEAALRTGVQDIGRVCSVGVQFLATADALSTQGFRQYAETQVKEHGHDYKFCKE
jgi:hypothetical protein